MDDEALVAALRSGAVAAAGLDVFAGEPEVHPAYFELPNVFMLPHTGSSTIEARLGMGADPDRGNPRVVEWRSAAEPRCLAIRRSAYAS